MARFCSLFSSSSGNCTYIGSGSGSILVDIGVSAKRTEQALKAIGVDPDSVQAVFVTHEHTDHISGIRVFAKKHNCRIFATAGTLEAMEKAGALDEKSVYEPISPNGTEAAGMFIRPFETPHDARESCGYTVKTADSKLISVCTDLGAVTETVMNSIYGSDLVLLESNHDVNMLMNGPYPYLLKRRILSPTGHLSNNTCAETAVRLVEGGTTRLFLGHLSKENNIPGLALETTRAALKMAGAHENLDYLLSLAGEIPAVTAF